MFARRNNFKMKNPNKERHEHVVAYASVTQQSQQQHRSSDPTKVYEDQRPRSLQAIVPQQPQQSLEQRPPQLPQLSPEQRPQQIPQLSREQSPEHSPEQRPPQLPQQQPRPQLESPKLNRVYIDMPHEYAHAQNFERENFKVIEAQGNGAPDTAEPESQVVIIQRTSSQPKITGSGAPAIDLGQRIQQLLQQQLKQDQEERKAVEQRNIQLEEDCKRLEKRAMDAEGRLRASDAAKARHLIEKDDLQRKCENQVQEIVRLKRQVRQIQDITRTWKSEENHVDSGSSTNANPIPPRKDIIGVRPYSQLTRLPPRAESPTALSHPSPYPPLRTDDSMTYCQDVCCNWKTR